MRRAWAAVLAVAAVGWVGFGAEMQRETYLQRDAGPQVVGYAILLTAPLAAACATLAVALATPPRGDRRLLAFIAVGTGLALLLFLLQHAWINAFVPDTGYAQVSVSTLASNADATPSLLVPILALGGGAVLAARWGLRWISGHPAATTSTPRREASRRLAVAPFLACAAWGLVRILVEGLPQGEESAYEFLLGGLALLYAAVSAVGVANVVAWSRGHAGWAPLERRLAWATLACLVATLLPFSAAVPALDRPLAFSAGLRGHTVFLATLLVPLYPVAIARRDVHRRTATEALPTASTRGNQRPLGTARTSANVLRRLGPSLSAAWPAWRLPGLAVAGVAATWTAAGVATLALPGSPLADVLQPGAVTPWLLAALVAAAFALALRDGASLAATLGLAAFAAWAIGNTEAAIYNPAAGSSGFLKYWPADADTPAVLLAWRILAGTLAAAALWLVVRRPGRSASIAVACGCVASIALLLLPVGIDTDTTSGSDATTAGKRIVSVGAVLAQQDPVVRMAMHLLAATFAVAAFVLLARRRGPEPQRGASATVEEPGAP